MPSIPIVDGAQPTFELLLREEDPYLVIPMMVSIRIVIGVWEFE
jgi:hypothetical protein